MLTRAQSPSAGTDLALLIARISLSALFIVSGWGKAFAVAGLANRLGEVGFPLPTLVAWLTVAVELGFGLALLVGWPARLAALGLLAFTVAASVLFHDFWSYAEPDRGRQLTQFLKNAGLVGGLLMVALTGPGRFSLGAWIPSARRSGGSALTAEGRAA